MIDSVAGRVLGTFAQQKLLEFLFDLVTGHRTCETKRREARGGGGYPEAATCTMSLLQKANNQNEGRLDACTLSKQLPGRKHTEKHQLVF